MLLGTYPGKRVVIARPQHRMFDLQAKQNNRMLAAAAVVVVVVYR